MRMLRGVYLVVYNINIANNINYATNISYFISRKMSIKNCRQFALWAPGQKEGAQQGQAEGEKGEGGAGVVGGAGEKGRRGKRVQGRRGAGGTGKGTGDGLCAGINRHRAGGRTGNMLSWFPREGRSRLIRRNRPRGSAGKSSEILAIRN